jgi:hypothetical protein
MRECEQLKCALGVPFASKKTRSNNNATATVVNASTIVTVDLIDEITVTAGPIIAMMTGTDVIITATTAVMTDATTTVAMTATTGVTTTEVLVVMIAMMITTMTDVMIDVTRTTTIARTATGRSGLLRHRPKGATPIVHYRRQTARSTSSSGVAKQSKATNRLDQTPGRSDTSTPKTRDLCGGLNSQSLSPEKIIRFTSLTPEPVPGRQPHSQWCLAA